MSDETKTTTASTASTPAPSGATSSSAPKASLEDYAKELLPQLSEPAPANFQVKDGVVTLEKQAQGFCGLCASRGKFDLKDGSTLPCKECRPESFQASVEAKASAEKALAEKKASTETTVK